MADTHRDASVSTLVFRNDEKGTRWEKDSLVAEEPLEIRLCEGGAAPERFVVTMRTPGDDDDLVAGLLYGEGVIEEIGEIVAIEPPADTHVSPELAKNVRVVTLAPRADRRRAQTMRPPAFSPTSFMVATVSAGGASSAPFGGAPVSEEQLARSSDSRAPERRSDR